MSDVHPSAIVEAGVTLGEGVEIGPGAVVRSGTVLGDGVTIGEYAVLGKRPKLGPKSVAKGGEFREGLVFCDKAGGAISGAGKTLLRDRR